MPTYICSIQNGGHSGRVPQLVTSNPESLARFAAHWDKPGFAVYTCVNPLKPGDRQLFFDRKNLQAMCRSCHAQKTAREVLGNPGKGADEQGMPLDPNHPWNQE
jgi:hypothetical protein